MSGQFTSNVARRFIGSWRYVGTTIDGKPRTDRGADPKGIIIYDPHGQMVCHIAPDREVQKAGKEPTGEEALAALADHIAYFGTWSVDEQAGTITHHREASMQPGDRGDLIRTFEFIGDRLILRPIGTTQDVFWERIK